MPLCDNHKQLNTHKLTYLVLTMSISCIDRIKQRERASLGILCAIQFVCCIITSCIIIFVESGGIHGVPRRCLNDICDERMMMNTEWSAILMKWSCVAIFTSLRGIHLIAFNCFTSIKIAVKSSGGILFRPINYIIERPTCSIGYRQSSMHLNSHCHIHCLTHCLTHCLSCALSGAFSINSAP